MNGDSTNREYLNSLKIMKSSIIHERLSRSGEKKCQEWLQLGPTREASNSKSFLKSLILQNIHPWNLREKWRNFTPASCHSKQAARQAQNSAQNARRIGDIPNIGGQKRFVGNHFTRTPSKQYFVSIFVLASLRKNSSLSDLNFSYVTEVEKRESRKSFLKARLHF